MDDPEPPEYEATPSTSLLLYTPIPIRPLVIATSSSLTIQAMEALILNDLVVLKKKSRFYSIGARVSVLTLLDCGTSWETIFKQTSMLESGVRKLQAKTIERS